MLGEFLADLRRPFFMREVVEAKMARNINNKIKQVARGGLLVTLMACQAQAGEMKVIRSGDNYKIKTGALIDTQNKKKGKLIIEVEATAGWKMNEKAPVVVDITAPESIDLENEKLRKSNITHKKANMYRFEVAYKKSTPASVDLKIKFDFVICTDTLCQKKRFEVSYSLSSG